MEGSEAVGMPVESEQLSFLHSGSHQLNITDHKDQESEHFQQWKKYFKDKLPKMVVNSLSISITSLLVCLCFWLTKSSEVVLEPGNYTVILEGESSQVHCESCETVIATMRERYGGEYTLTEADITGLYEHVEATSGTVLCCSKTPVQVLSLVDARLRQMANFSIAPPTNPQKNRVSLHATLQTHSGDASYNPQDISKHEWSFQEDFSFCEPGAPRTPLCDEIRGNSSDNGGIRIPFHGYFAIDVRVSWQSPELQGMNTTCTLEISIQPPYASGRQILAADNVHPAGSCTFSPCASTHINRTFRLSRDTEVFITVSNKPWITRSHTSTFLEIRGESF